MAERILYCDVTVKMRKKLGERYHHLVVGNGVTAHLVEKKGGALPLCGGKFVGTLTEGYNFSKYCTVCYGRALYTVGLNRLVNKKRR